jgi:hypothetical protein
MRVLANPVVRYNATLMKVKSTAKGRFPQEIGLLPIFFLFLPDPTRFFAMITVRYGPKSLGRALRGEPYFRPKSTFFFGSRDFAMGSFNASTMGAKSLKCLASVAAKLGSSAVSAGSVVLNPHCLHLIRSIAG